MREASISDDGVDAGAAGSAPHAGTARVNVINQPTLSSEHPSGMRPGFSHVDVADIWGILRTGGTRIVPVHTHKQQTAESEQS